MTLIKWLAEYEKLVIIWGWLFARLDLVIIFTDNFNQLASRI